MKLILLIFFVVTLLGGIGMMAYGYRRNVREGSKRYHPGNRFVNIGLMVIIASGLALAVLGSLEMSG
ncbi:MAG: hypothetical protein ACYTAF_08675 [Planctomycetota bacterium]